jgi:lipid-A-disaccharide synthase
MNKPQILISAAEASGDMYAARLAEALQRRAPMTLFGLGGERMREAGVELTADYHKIAAMGLAEVAGKIPRALRILRRLEKEAVRRKPALSILVDSPGMNFPLARRLHPRGFRFVYFISPQIWAWRSGRVKALRKRIEEMLVIFPFEAGFYERAGIRVRFVGHPLVDTVRATQTREEFAARHGLDAARPIITILPGSRLSELRYHLPVIAGAAQLVSSGGTGRRAPQYVLAAAGNLRDEEFAPLERAGVKVILVREETYNALAAADCAIVSSGTATVETALLGVPMVVIYRVSGVTAAVARHMVHTPYFAMPNLIQGREMVPELIQNALTPETLARQVSRLLDEPEQRAAMRTALAEMRAKLGPGGAIDRASERIVQLLEGPVGKATVAPGLVS